MTVSYYRNQLEILSNITNLFVKSEPHLYRILYLFIPLLIEIGAAQADTALLVIPASRGEYESR
jgi:hypothetical protein